MTQLRIQASPEFNEVRMKYQDYALTEFLMMQYIKIGTFKAMEDKYFVTKTTIKLHIEKYIDEVKFEKPYLYDLYKYKTDYNKKNPKKTDEWMKQKKEQEQKEKLQEKHFKKLPGKIEYGQLRDWADANYNTGNLTGEEIVEMALEQGVKVYEKYKGKERFLLIKGGTVKWTYCSN